MDQIHYILFINKNSKQNQITDTRTAHAFDYI